MAIRKLGAACLAVALLSSAANAAIVSASVSYGVKIQSINGPDAATDLDYVVFGGPQYNTSTIGAASAFADAMSSNGDFPASPFVSSAEIDISATPASVPSSASAWATNEILLYIENQSLVNTYEVELNFFYDYAFSLGAPFTSNGEALVQGWVTEGTVDPVTPVCGSDFNFNYDTNDAPFAKTESGNCTLTEILGPSTPSDPSFYQFYTYMSAYGETFEAPIPLPAGAVGLISALGGLAGLGAWRRRRGERQQL